MNTINDSHRSLAPAGRQVTAATASALIAFSLLCSPASAASGQRAGANDEELKQRVETLEHKLDRVLELLEKQNKTPETNAKTTMGSDADEAQPDVMGGGLKLRLFMVEGFDLRSVPGNLRKPVASAEVAVPETYDWGAFTQIASMKRYQAETSGENNRYQAALQWSGILNVAETGETQFVVSLNVGQRSGSEACVGLLQIDGQDVVRLESQKSTSGYGDQKERFGSEFGNVDLAKGPHDFAFWVYCTGAKRWNGPDHNQVHFTIDKTGPGEENPTPLKPAELSLKE